MEKENYIFFKKKKKGVERLKCCPFYMRTDRDLYSVAEEAGELIVNADEMGERT
jgi:hypothetical protein